MHRIIHSVRARALKWAARILDRALAACEQGLHTPEVWPHINALIFSQSPVEHTDPATERQVIFQILQRLGARSQPELATVLRPKDPLAIGEALRALEAEGVLYCAGKHVWASRGTRHLDALGLIAI
jgi:hypothetical protein